MSSRLVYATLLQIEYLVSLVTAYLLGSEKWLLFGVSLAVCLVLGFGTTWMYWVLLDKATKP